MRRYVLPRTLAVTLALGVALLAGCAGQAAGDDVATAGGAAKTTPAASGGPSPAADANERMRQFARCMRDHGVNMPDPEPGERPVITVPAGVDKSTVVKAQEACQKYLPAGARDRANDPARQESLRQYARCMREHGVDVPDPDPNDGGLRIDKDKLKNDPAFLRANEACQDKIKRPSPGASR